MKRKQEIRDELQEIAQGLSKVKPEDGFVTPHNYFRELPDQVMTKITAQEIQPESKWGFLYMIRRPAFAVAFGSIVLGVLAISLLLRPPVSRQPLAEITADEAVSYVLNNLQDFSSEDLISTGLFTEWNASEVVPMTDQEMEEILQDEELIEELIN
jgi:hypothetical protein